MGERPHGQDRIAKIASSASVIRARSARMPRAAPAQMNLRWVSDFHALKGFVADPLHGSCQRAVVHHLRVRLPARSPALTSSNTIEEPKHGHICRQTRSETVTDAFMRTDGRVVIPADRQVQDRDCRAARHFQAASLILSWRERKPVSPAVAVQLGKLFGDGAAVWVRMQGAYDIWHAERELAAEIKPDFPVEERLPPKGGVSGCCSGMERAFKYSASGRSCFRPSASCKTMAGMTLRGPRHA